MSLTIWFFQTSLVATTVFFRGKSTQRSQCSGVGEPLLGDGDKFWEMRKFLRQKIPQKLLAHKFRNLSNSWKWTQISCQGHFKRHYPSLNHQLSSWWILGNMAGQKFSRASFFGAGKMSNRFEPGDEMRHHHTNPYIPFCGYRATFMDGRGCHSFLFILYTPSLRLQTTTLMLEMSLLCKFH